MAVPVAVLDAEDRTGPVASPGLPSPAASPAEPQMVAILLGMLGRLDGVLRELDESKYRRLWGNEGNGGNIRP